MQPEALFPRDYAEARERFRAAARAAGAALDVLALEARGPGGEALTIDIATIGDPQARRVLLHACGLHGVEAFAGSAVQLAALAGPAPPPGCALALVHVLNPYGMAWLRRANENNVDLNRNFLSPGERWEGAPPLYARIDRLLNPPSPPRADAFTARLLLLGLRHGFRALKQAIVGGQHDFPRGLFYGGNALQPGPALFLEWLGRRFYGVEHLLALDLHTGLGRHGGEMLIREPGVGATPPAELGAALGHDLIDLADDPGRPYRIRGGMGAMLPHVLPRARIDFVLQEIGTAGPLTVLRALRDENRWHHYGAATLEHPAKSALLAALCPASPRWRRRAVEHGSSLLRAAARWIWREVR